ncbi:MAG: ABC transporter permease [Chloroflexi bacterium]|nr:ABC transporter permease [Chloroflexota bacterium]
MVIYVLKRLLALVPILLGASFLSFALARATPVDPVLLLLGDYATPEAIVQLRHQLGLDDPFLVQYGRYLWNALHGDLGTSLRGQTPVMREILSYLPPTFQLALAAMAYAIVTGISLGTLAATASGKLVDGAAMVIAFFGLSVPSFWLGIILVIIFGVQLKWVSVLGTGELKDLILPAFCLGLAPAAVIARLTRSCILEVVREDYVRTAQSKGLQDLIVSLRHVLPNALIPVVTVIGLQFGHMLGGTVFIEAVFARPGLGTFAIDAISHRDYPQIQGMVLFMATVFVMVNLVVDLLYGFLDPRIRLAQS